MISILEIVKIMSIIRKILSEYYLIILALNLKIILKEMVTAYNFLKAFIIIITLIFINFF